MCLAIPVKVMQLLANQMARVNIGGIEKNISVALLAEVAVGDYVILHVGYALSRLNEGEAIKTLTLFEQMLQAENSPHEIPQ